MQFKIGDLIELKDEYKDRYPSLSGRPLQVYKVNTTYNEVQLKNDQYQFVSYKEEMFNLVKNAEDASTPELKEGDWVRVLKDDKYVGLTAGEIFQVEKTVNGMCFLKGGPFGRFAMSRFQKIDDVCDPRDVPGAPYKVGDWVVCVDNAACVGIDKGNFYQVRNMYPDTVCLMDISGMYGHSRFEKCNPPSKIEASSAIGDLIKQELGKIKAAAQAKPISDNAFATMFATVSPASTVSKQHVFKPGDYVKCVNPGTFTGLKQDGIYQVELCVETPYLQEPCIKLREMSNLHYAPRFVLWDRSLDLSPKNPIPSKDVEFLVVPESGIALSKSCGFKTMDEAVKYAERETTTCIIYVATTKVEPAKITSILKQG
jgi:hypothetical protein